MYIDFRYLRKGDRKYVLKLLDMVESDTATGLSLPRNFLAAGVLMS
jgi:hypothetical protein